MKHFIERIHTHSNPENTATLSIQQRVRSRQRIRLSNGEDALMEIERGLTLRDGDTLRTADGETIRIISADECVSRIITSDCHLLARVCYHLGNRHVPLEIKPTWVSYLHDHVLDDMVIGLGTEVQVIHAPFEPEDGAYGGQSHVHSHSHEHNH